MIQHNTRAITCEQKVVDLVWRCRKKILIRNLIVKIIVGLETLSCLHAVCLSFSWVGGSGIKSLYIQVFLFDFLTRAFSSEYFFAASLCALVPAYLGSHVRFVVTRFTGCDMAVCLVFTI